MAAERGLYSTIGIIRTGIIPNKLRGNLKLLIVRPGLYVVMQNAVVLSTWHIVRDFLPNIEQEFIWRHEAD